MQEPGLAIGTGQGDGREAARLVAASRKLRRDFGEMLFSVAGEAGHAPAEHPVVAVAGQHVHPRCGELIGVGYLR